MIKAKYIIFAWVYPLIAILLFVAAMCCLIHEGAFHNFQRPQKAYYAIGLVIITFINGMVAVLISAHFKRPKKKECEHYFVLECFDDQGDVFRCKYCRETL